MRHRFGRRSEQLDADQLQLGLEDVEIALGHARAARDAVAPRSRSDQPRKCDLAQWIRDEFQLSVTRHTLGRELRALGYRKVTARPRHRGQKPDDIAIFKKSSLPVWSKSNEASRQAHPRIMAAR
jgi:hypothetical protein